MARRREPTPWGFHAETWQALAFALLGLLAITNAAWFYSLRVARTEAAAATLRPKPRVTERVIYQTPDGQPAAIPTPEPAAAPRPLAADEQCINGTRFRVQGSTWTQAGEAC